MTLDDLRKALIGIVISQMETYNNTIMNVSNGNKLHRDVNWDIHQMWDAWWKIHFPFFDYAFKIETKYVTEPIVTLRWTHDHSINRTWEELMFKFSPVRLDVDNDFDYIAAYDRAMAIL